MVTLRVLGPLILSAWVSAAGPACQSDGKILRRDTLTCRNKQYIVDFHNKIRNFVASGGIASQPKAANMIEMRWSERLAKLAQKRADTCDFEHGDLELDGERVGQNLAIFTSSVDNLRLNITKMVLLWYREVFQFGYDGEFNYNTGHYSQLIWANTREIGCGFTYYKDNVDNWYKMYFVCDYYPPGNYIKKKPYVYGKQDCEEHGLVESSRYSKLCAIDKTVTNICRDLKELNESVITGNDTKLVDNEMLMISQELVKEMNMTEDNVTIFTEETTDWGPENEMERHDDDSHMEVIIENAMGSDNSTTMVEEVTEDNVVLRTKNNETTTEFSEFPNEIEPVSDKSPERTHLFLKVIGIILIGDENSKFNENGKPSVSFVGAPEMTVSNQPSDKDTPGVANEDNVKFLSRLIELLTKGVTIL